MGYTAGVFPLILTIDHIDPNFRTWTSKYLFQDLWNAFSDALMEAATS